MVRGIVSMLLAAFVLAGAYAIAQTPAAGENTPEQLIARASTLARGQARLFDAPPRALSESASQRAATVSYPAGPIMPSAPSSTQRVEVSIANGSDVAWRAAGPDAVALSYHLYDLGGKLIAWDGLRSALSRDLAPGDQATFSLDVALPPKTGTYLLKTDLVREGKEWFSAPESLPALPLRVTADLDAGYGATTTPASIIPGAEVNIDVHLTNDGLMPWLAGGDHPIRLGYHWFDMSSRAVVWDGARTLLPRDVAPGGNVTVTVDIRAPEREGAYALAWDMVAEGQTWFSTAAVPMKEDLIVVQSGGVTFYGKGWGHGIGLSPWGAQGM